MKKCTYCGKEHTDDAGVCTVDAEPLVSLVSPPPVGEQLEHAKAQDRPKGAVRRFLLGLDWFFLEENSRSKITCRYCGGEDGEHAASCQEHGTFAPKQQAPERIANLPPSAETVENPASREPTSISRSSGTAPGGKCLMFVDALIIMDTIAIAVLGLCLSDGKKGLGESFKIVIYSEVVCVVGFFAGIINRHSIAAWLRSLLPTGSYSLTQPASTRAQTVGMICAIVNLVTYFALPVFQFSILKFTMYDLADKVGGVTVSLWLVPIVAGVYLFFFFQKRTSVTPLFVKSVGGSLVIALLFMIFRAILFSKDIDPHGTIDFKEAFSQFSVFDVLGLGFYASGIASATALIFPSRSTPDRQPLNQQQALPIVTALNTGAGILTLEEVAHKLRVTLPEATTLVESGALKAKKIGDQWRVSETALNAFMNN